MMGDTPTQTPRRVRKLNGSTVRGDRRNFSQAKRGNNLEETRNTIMRNLGKTPVKSYPERSRTEDSGSPVRRAEPGSQSNNQMDGDLIDLSDDPFYERNNGAKRVNEERRAQSFIPPPSAVRRKKRKSLTESIERRRSGEYRVLGSPKRLPPEFWASSAEFIYQEPQPYQEPNPGSNEEPEPNQEIEEPELEDQNYRDNDQENYQENYRDNDQENYRDNDQEELQREPIGYEAASDDYDAYNSSANGQLSLLEPEYYDEPMLNNDQNSELRYEEQLANLEAKQQAEIASYHAQLAGRDREISALRTALEESERQLSANLRQRSELVTKVSTRLHEQYSRKHQVKVTALKKAYEARWQSRVSRLEAEVSRLQELVKKERQEKNELVKTCDQFLDMMNQSGQ